MRVAIVDSGIFAAHPLVGPIAGGVAIVGEDLTDHLGHGTAVAATIRASAPTAELFVVKIFDRSLACPIDTLVAGLEWCIANGMDLVNLSVGTTGHAEILSGIAARIRIVAPAGTNPGDLEGVIRVTGSAKAGSLEGPSFAVARHTGQLAK